MNISVRSALIASVTTLTIGAVAAAPSVQPLPPPRPAIHLTAAVQPLAAPPVFTPGAFFANPTQRFVFLPSAGQPFPTPVFPPVIGGTSIDSTIKNVYNAIEPWVQWGFEVAAYAVGWIPYVGWLAPQINIFYNLVERIVRSGVFNFADWLGGNGSALQNLGQFGVDTINSFIFFANDQIHFWLPSLPPLPPLPPIFGGSLTTTTATTSAAATGGNLLDGVLAPITNGIGDGNGSGNGRGFLQGAISHIPLLSDFTKATLPGPAADAVDAVDTTTVADKTDTRIPPGRQISDLAKTVGNGVVRAQGEVRGALANAASDVADAIHPGKPGKASDDVSTASTTTSVKGLGDTVHNAVKGVQKAAKEARDAAKNGSGDDK
jgi:hypothetical protein